MSVALLCKTGVCAWMVSCSGSLLGMDAECIDFTVEDEMSSVTLIIEDQCLYVHKEVLAAWSPVFRSMFTRNFKEKEQREIELPDKKVDEFIELLHCMYPPIKAVSGESFVYCFDLRKPAATI